MSRDPRYYEPDPIKALRAADSAAPPPAPSPAGSRGAPGPGREAPGPAGGKAPAGLAPRHRASHGGRPPALAAVQEPSFYMPWEEAGTVAPQLSSPIPQYSSASRLTELPAEPGPFRSLTAGLGSFPLHNASELRRCQPPGAGRCQSAAAGLQCRLAIGQRRSAAAVAAVPPPHHPAEPLGQGVRLLHQETTAVSCSSVIIKQLTTGW
ncbi:translation initiation factor IF-2-like isoform X2 [Grus americana]|uniref:translation initiation factor IF-2-like isoform X2 n=1 Tax=Grus americana TaxID=9117 RepID=UPI0024086374|nr:translation initiation factor IF-2-like isoform X2 [Grus americana]